jgi:hypothetical protein
LNQDLSGFSRARRPATQEWEVRRAASRSDSSTGCLPAPSSSLLFDCQRSPACAGRTSGRDASAIRTDAPLAVAVEPALVAVAHRLVVNRIAGPAPETSKGRLVFPGGPSAQMTFYIICLENLRGSSLPCPDRARTPYRRVRRRAVRGTDRSWNGSGTATPRDGRAWRRVAGYVLAGGVTRVFSGRLSVLSSRTAMRTER